MTQQDLLRRIADLEKQRENVLAGLTDCPISQAQVQSLTKEIEDTRLILKGFTGDSV